MVIKATAQTASGIWNNVGGLSESEQQLVGADATESGGLTDGDAAGDRLARPMTTVADIISLPGPRPYAILGESRNRVGTRPRLESGSRPIVGLRVVTHSDERLLRDGL